MLFCNDNKRYHSIWVLQWIDHIWTNRLSFHWRILRSGNHNKYSIEIWMATIHKCIVELVYHWKISKIRKEFFFSRHKIAIYNVRMIMLNSINRELQLENTDISSIIWTDFLFKNWFEIIQKNHSESIWHCWKIRKIKITHFCFMSLTDSFVLIILSNFKEHHLAHRRNVHFLP